MVKSKSGAMRNKFEAKKVVMGEKIAEKYLEERLPRYTSYPSAPNFSDTIGADVHKKWLSNISKKEPVSLYLHIPFCRSMCWYCGCHTKVSLQDAPIHGYLSPLHQEIMTIAKIIGHPVDVDQIHFGGGTPTIIGSSEFSGLMKRQRENFRITKDTKIAVEIDPRTLTNEMIDALAQAGVTRASLGVQSFDPIVQKAINRIQTCEQTETAVSSLRDAGIREISFDLIYGLPHQTIQSCIQTTQQAMIMHPERFSVFGYAHIPSFKKHQEMIEESALPNGRERYDQAEAIADTLVKGGYKHIGLDHFALPHDTLARAQENKRLHRNFQGYTTDQCKTLIGFGASSISQFEQGYIQNQVSLGRYDREIKKGTLATAKGYALSADDRLRAKIIEELMCNFEVDLEESCARFARGFHSLLDKNKSLHNLASEGFVEIKGGKITVNKAYKFIVRKVAASFDAYLNQTTRTHSKAS